MRELSDASWTANPALRAAATGALLHMQAKGAGALNAYREALALDPHSPIAKAGVLFMANRSDKVARLGDLHEAWPRLEAPAYYLAVALWQTDATQALSLVDECLSLHPGSVRAAVLRGNLLAARGEREATATIAREVAGATPGLPRYQRWAAALLWRTGNRAEAYRLLLRPAADSGGQPHPILALTLPLRLMRPSRLRGLAVVLGAIAVTGLVLPLRTLGNIAFWVSLSLLLLLLAGMYAGGGWDTASERRALKRERAKGNEPGSSGSSNRSVRAGKELDSRTRRRRSVGSP